jgi:TRAP transporter TAXI family solute receptor
MRRLLIMAVVLILTVFTASLALAAGKSSYQIGTGGEQGCYYAVGQVLAKLAAKSPGLKLKVNNSSGSVANINAVMNGKMTFGLAQSDRVLQARTGEAEWRKSGPQQGLRAICGLYDESVVLVASSNSRIKECRDLRGKRVAVGAPGSGIRQNSLDALKSCRLGIKDLALAEPINAEAASKKLQSGKLDAFFYTAGHPNELIRNAAKGRVKVKLVGFPDVCRSRDFCYIKSWVPLESYPGLLNKGHELQTCGLKAVLVTSAKTPNNAAYKMAELIGQNLDELKRMHPSLRRLKLYEMTDDLHAPLHPGAKRYFQEKGIVK